MSKKELKPNTLLMPTPVVLASCVDKEGNQNIITLAWVGIVSSVPPTVSISIRPSRFSHRLISETKDFVLNVPSEELLKETDICGSLSGRDINKFEHCRLTSVKSSIVKSPRIEECPINLECKVSQVISLGSHDMFIAEIVAVYANEEILTDGKVDVAKLKPIAYCPHDYWSINEKIGSYGYSQKN